MAGQRLSPSSEDDDSKTSDQEKQEVKEIAGAAQLAWFGLLGFLAFYTIVILSTRDVDFLSAGKETQLPVVQIAVRTEMFFYAAPVLATALYVYLHFLCIVLWDQAQRIKDPKTLSLALRSSLIGSVALSLKQGALPRGVRQELKGAGNVGAIGAAVLLWLAQPTVLLASLSRSDAAQPLVHWSLSVQFVTWASLVVSVAFGAASLWFALGIGHRRREAALVWGIGVLAAGTLAYWLPPTISIDREIVGDAAGFDPGAERRDVFRAQWCAAEGKPLSVCAVRATTADDRRTLDYERRDYCRNVLGTRSLALCNSRFAAWDARFAADWKRVRQAELNSVPEIGLSDRVLSGMSAIAARLPRARLERAKLDGVEFKEAALEGAVLIQADLHGAKGQYAAFDFADLTRADLSASTFRTGSFEHAVLPAANLRGADLFNAGLEDANLTAIPIEAKDRAAEPRAVLDDGQWIVPADLTFANLGEARLQRAQLKNAVLDGAILDGAVLDGATGLTQKQLALAVGDEKTRLPAGSDLSIATCWVRAPTVVRAIVDESGERHEALEALVQKKLCRGHLPTFVHAPARTWPSDPLAIWPDRQHELPTAEAEMTDVTLRLTKAWLQMAGYADGEGAHLPLPELIAEVSSKLRNATGPATTAQPTPEPQPTAQTGGDGVTPASGPRQIAEIRFDLGEADLSPGGRSAIAAAAASLTSARYGHVRVIGFTDRVGAAPRNQDLARKRADTVAAALIDKGVPASRVGVESKGEDMPPVATEDGVSEPANRTVLILANPEVRSASAAD